MSANLTPKGSATRDRIIGVAADLVLARGVGGTTLDDIRAGTATSKSQLFHYFPGGKSDLVGSIAAFQGERVFAAQQPYLDELDTWESWDGWRAAVLAHYSSQPQFGCPISALASELIGKDSDRDHELVMYMNRWRGYLLAGIARMRSAGLLREDIDPKVLSLSVFSALHGGLLLMQTMQSVEPLEAALEGALTMLHAAAAIPTFDGSERRKSLLAWRRSDRQN
jgi:AcrR family transcriptional regulator